MGTLTCGPFCRAAHTHQHKKMHWGHNNMHYVRWHVSLLPVLITAECRGSLWFLNVRKKIAAQRSQLLFVDVDDWTMHSNETWYHTLLIPNSLFEFTQLTEKHIVSLTPMTLSFTDSCVCFEARICHCAANIMDVNEFLFVLFREF